MSTFLFLIITLIVLLVLYLAMDYQKYNIDEHITNLFKLVTFSDNRDGFSGSSVYTGSGPLNSVVLGTTMGSSGFDLNNIYPIPQNGVPGGYYKIEKPFEDIVISLLRAANINIDTSNGIMSYDIYGLGYGNRRPTVDTGSGTQNVLRYDPNTYNVEYHDSIEDIIEKNDVFADQTKTVYVRGSSGDLVAIPWNEVKGQPIYNEPGSFRFGPSNYVPNYENSVYLSRTTQFPTTTEVRDTNKQMGGFCSYHKKNKDRLEQTCNAIDPEHCASVSCCVLLGGTKCVHGNSKGPTLKSNYSDMLIKNKDVYFHQGKCYGNCDED